jgi:hypothetical protein
VADVLQAGDKQLALASLRGVVSVPLVAKP